MNKKSILIPIVASFFLTGILSGLWPSAGPAYAQTNVISNQTTAAAIDQLAANLTQAKESIANGNTTATTAQLTAIIGELSDVLGKVTSDPNGPHMDEHTHFFTHKGHTHTVTLLTNIRIMQAIIMTGSKNITSSIQATVNLV
jgi:hypothetical protein